MSKYFIGHGTGIIKKFDTLEEMLDFHKNMNSLDRHFCKLYDRVKHRIIDGWEVQLSNYSDDSKWRKW
jgi:hypothetical protein